MERKVIIIIFLVIIVCLVLERIPVKRSISEEEVNIEFVRTTHTYAVIQLQQDRHGRYVNTPMICRN